MLKKIIVGIILFTIMIVSLALLLNNKKGKITNKVLSVKMAHNYVDDALEGRKINIVLYFTEENEFNTENVVEGIYITDEEENTKIVLDIIKITKTNIKYTIDKVEYEAYDYKLLLPSVGYSYSLDEAYIKIVSKGKNVKCEIGTMNVIYYPELGEENSITIGMVEGYNVEYPFTTVGAIHMKIENRTNNLIKIKKIVIDEDILVDNSQINNEIDYSSYQIEGSYCNDELDVNIYSYGTVELELPLKYLKLKQLKETSLTVYYDYLGEENMYILDSFNFFDDNFSVPLLKKVVKIYDYD